MGLFDINPKLIEQIKAKINKLSIGLNKEEKKVLVNALDESTHVHYHNEIGLTEEAILKLSPEEVGKFVKEKTFANHSKSIKDKNTMVVCE